MLREVPPLYDAVLKVIARYPSKSLTKSKCEKLMDALKNQCFGDRDIIQILLNQIIDGGRMTDDAMPTFIYDKRQELSFSNSKISGKYLVSATSYCGQNLLKLDISGCFQINNEHIYKLLEQCPNLMKLNIKNCRKLNDDLFHYIINNYNKTCQIIEFNIGGNFNITDDGIQFFINHYYKNDELIELSLSGLNISDETILLISKKCKSLISLGCGYLDLKETTIQTLMNQLGSQLEIFDWSWPSTNPVVQNVQPSAAFIVDTLTTLCPSLREVDLTGNRNLMLPHIIDFIERKLASVSQIYLSYDVLSKLTSFFFSFLFDRLLLIQRN